MDKQAVYTLLAEQGIPHQITEHPAVYNMEEVSHLELPYPEDDAKNLFVMDDKRRNYYMITVRGDKRVDLKAFRKAHGLRALRFASAEDLMALLGLIPGAVTPMGLLNDADHRVTLYLDSSFLTGAGRIGVHPNDNTATVWLAAADLVKLLTDRGCTVHPVEV